MVKGMQFFLIRIIARKQWWAKTNVDSRNFIVLLQENRNGTIVSKISSLHIFTILTMVMSPSIGALSSTTTSEKHVM